MTFWENEGLKDQELCGSDVKAGLEISISNRYYILCFSVIDYRRCFF